MTTIYIRTRKLSLDDFAAATGLYVPESLDLRDTPITRLPQRLRVVGDLLLSRAKSIPASARIGGRIRIAGGDA